MVSPDETTRIVIYTDSYRIDGAITLLPGARLTDFIRNASDFIPVIDATIWDKKGAMLFKTPFLDVGRGYIELIVPAALVQPPTAV